VFFLVGFQHSVGKINNVLWVVSIYCSNK